MLNYLKSELKNYELVLKGDSIIFKCELEDFYAEYPLRLLVEMFKLDKIDEMFLYPAIVPY